MAGIPQNFQSISNVLPTYNFIDIASGTGYVLFYAGTTVDKKVLSNFTFYSDIVAETPATVTHGAGNTLEFDHDYDCLLNRPLNIAGLGVVNIPIALYATSESTNVYVIVTLRKWTGSVETDIVSNTSRVFNDNSDAFEMLAVDLDVPLTHFKIGEYLRLTIQLYGNNSDPADDCEISYAHDPKSRTDGWDATGAVPSQLIFQCPVRLNL
jgi:hypothetical protein